VNKKILFSFLLFLSVFIIDQNIKALFLDGYRFYGECIDLILVYNKGVAFTLFAFLDEYLKWIQIVLLIGVITYIIYEKLHAFILPIAIVVGAGASNIYDRFIHEGVVDYFYWHCGFNFAIFNFADVMINVAVILIAIIHYKESSNKKEV
jgi:signal peptidase II